jgi:predicted nucleic acid-binding protein
MGLSILHSLKNIKTVALDSAPFIYYIEEHKTYLKIIEPLFNQISHGRLTAYTSFISLIEVLIKPLEEKNENLVEKYENLLTNSENLIICDIDKQISIETAKIRTTFKLRIPDAIQLATAIISGAEAFITNDTSLKKIKKLKVIVLDDYK